MNKRIVYAHRGVIMIGLLLGTLVACDGGEKSKEPEIKVENVWGRPSPKMAESGAVYMVIKNDGGEADKLMAVETDVCEIAELHESFMEGDVMRMRPVEGGYIEVPAGGSAELKPGGYHVRLIKLKAPLEAGTSVPLTLVFEKSAKFSVDAEIRD